MINSSAQYPSEISEARKVESVAKLLETIAASTPIEYSPSDDKLWGNVTSLGRTTIYYSKTAHASEALAHELLHAELKISGYLQYLVSVAKTPCTHRNTIIHLFGILDNELQHHRIAVRFSSLGLRDKYFYHDGDVHTYKKVRRIVENMSSANTVVEFFTQFVTVIAPLGAGTDTERNQLKNILKLRSGAQTAKRLDEIESVFAEWRASDALDAGPFIERILHLLDVRCTLWVGTSQSFPTDGFFVGDRFELAEAQL